MICVKCGKEMPEDSVFCPFCGQKVEFQEIPEPEEQMIDAAAAEQETVKKVCPCCNSVLESTDMFCSNCGKALNALKKKRRFRIPKKGVIVTISIVAVLLIAGVFTNWFGVKGPAVQMAAAVTNTLAAKSFSFDFSYTYNEYREYTNEASGTAYVNIDLDRRDLTIYADVDIGNESAILAIYDGYYLTYSDHNYTIRDISELLDEWFDTYEDGMENGFKLQDVVDSVTYKGYYAELAKHLDLEEMDKCIVAFLKNLNSKKWLQENAGYSVEREGQVTKHQFAPNAFSLLKACLVQFEDAFADPSEYNEAYDDLRELRTSAKYTDIGVSFSTKASKLSGITLDIAGPYEGITYGDGVHIAVDFYDIGKTELDVEELEDMLRAANQGH